MYAGAIKRKPGSRHRFIIEAHEAELSVYQNSKGGIFVSAGLPTDNVNQETSITFVLTKDEARDLITRLQKNL